MEIKYEIDKITWDSFHSEQESDFLQSYDWGDFQAAGGRQVFRLGVIAENSLAAAATLVKTDLGLGRSYLYCPRGPVFAQQSNEAEKLIFGEIRELANREKAIFLRFEPLGSWLISRFPAGELKRTIDIQPAKTQVLDLTVSALELQKDQHQKTRYNIRLAEKKGVSVRAAMPDDFDSFWELMIDTTKRDGFRPHGRAYYQKMLAYPLVRLYLAEYDGKILAAGLFAFFGKKVTYLHGASSNEHRNLMAPYLLQWELIMTAKRENFSLYDFHGIDESKWPGVTRFKKGFGGNEKHYPGTYDLVFDRVWYNGYSILRKLRRLI